MPGIQVPEQIGERVTRALDRLRAAGIGTKDRRDADLDGHGWCSSVWPPAGDTAVADVIGFCLSQDSTGEPAGSFRRRLVLPRPVLYPAVPPVIRTSSSRTSPSTIRNDRNSVRSGSRVETRT